MNRREYLLTWIAGQAAPGRALAASPLPFRYLPNPFAIWMLAPKLKEQTRRYFELLRKGEFTVYK